MVGLLIMMLAQIGVYEGKGVDIRRSEFWHLLDILN
jgi:hypothetical protein